MAKYEVPERARYDQIERPILENGKPKFIVALADGAVARRSVLDRAAELLAEALNDDADAEREPAIPALGETHTAFAERIASEVR